MIGDSLFFQAHNETSTRRELSKEDGSGKKKSVGSDEKGKLRVGQSECLPFIRPLALDAPRMAQDLVTGQEFPCGWAAT